MSTTSSFADRLRKARADLGWSQEDLARKSGIASITISRYERGVAAPLMANLRKLADALKASPDWLLRGNGDSRSRSDMDAT